MNFPGLLNEIVGGIPLGRQDDNHAVTPAVGLGDDPGDIADTIGVGHRAAAEFLYN